MIPLQQVLSLVRAEHLEVICGGPFRVARALLPAIQNFHDFNPLAFPEEPARGFLGFVPGITFHSNWNQLHNG